MNQGQNGQGNVNTGVQIKAKNTVQIRHETKVGNPLITSVFGLKLSLPTAIIYGFQAINP